ncbi:MAG TPA: hypothetical protein VF988_03650 [Verrucomicrobiae bacterium]
MSTFKTLTDAQAAKLAGTAALNGITVIAEDTGDLPTEISEALGSVGLIVLLGIPSFKNDTSFSGGINAEVDQQILIQECPSVWRNDPTHPHCQDVAIAVAAALQGLIAPGFQLLRVVNGETLGNIKPDPNNPISLQHYKLELKTRLQIQPA